MNENDRQTVSMDSAIASRTEKTVFSSKKPEGDRTRREKCGFREPRGQRAAPATRALGTGVMADDDAMLTVEPDEPVIHNVRVQHA